MKNKSPLLPYKGIVRKRITERTLLSVERQMETDPAIQEAFDIAVETARLPAGATFHIVVDCNE